MRTNSAGASHQGRVRNSNEDRFHVDPPRGLYVVIDGVGGQAGGEIAAETALLQIRTRLERDAGSAEERLREAITLANNEIHRLSRTNAEWAGMACVLTAAIVDGGQVTVGHVGDSRLYKVRRGAIEKLTHDHSPVGEREDAGELGELEAMRHPRRNEVFRDIGSEPHTPTDRDFVEIIKAPFEEDAAFLLCSDGLSDLVTSQQMLSVIQRHAGSPDEVVHTLIGEANRAGGKDNVTVIYIEGSAFAHADYTARSVGGGTRRAATHTAALLMGVALGAVAATYIPGWLQQLIPGAPLTAVSETPRSPRTLLVQQAAAAEFATIGDALASAHPGDTVVVGPGDYRERITLPAGVTVMSQLPHRAVIRLPDLVSNAPAVTVDGVRGARLQGVQIVGDEGRMPIGVLVLNGQLELQDVRISGTTDAGIDLWGGTEVTLRANDVADNAGVGVRVRSGARPALLHNRIVRNGRARPAAPGVLLDHGAIPVLVGNIIAGNGTHGIAGVAPANGAEYLRNNVFVADTRQNARGALAVVGAQPPGPR